MDIIQHEIHYDDGSIDTLYPQKINLPTLPPDKKFARIKHDYEIYKLSRPSRNEAANHVIGLPETVKVLYPRWVELTPQWQTYMVDILSLARYKVLFSQLSDFRKKEIMFSFKGITHGNRAFTNQRGWNYGFADYINNVNPNGSPMQQETINTGGNVVEILGNKENRGGKEVYKVRMLNGTKPPPDPLLVNSVTTPWLVVKATNSMRAKIMNGGTWTGKWKEDIVDPFHWNGGADCPVAFVGIGDFNYIEATRIELLKPGSVVPSPYLNQT